MKEANDQQEQEAVTSQEIKRSPTGFPVLGSHTTCWANLEMNQKIRNGSRSCRDQWALSVSEPSQHLYLELYSEIIKLKN